MKVTGLTKKAIYYYEEEGLISPYKEKDNNYRVYSDADIKTLAQISVLRRLDIPLYAISEILKNPHEIKNIMKEQVHLITEKIHFLNKNKDLIENFVTGLNDCNLNSAMEELEELNKVLIADSKTRAGYMMKELDRIFPGNFGKLLSFHYGQFLYEPLDSDEKFKAWEELVNDLDEIEEIEYTENIQKIINKYYGKITKTDLIKINEISKQAIERLLTRKGSPSEEEPLEAKRKVEEYYTNISNKKEIQDFSELQQFLSNYQSVFKRLDKHIMVLSSKFRKLQDIIFNRTGQNA